MVLWQDTVEKCIQSIVTIKATRVRSFDTDTPTAYTATGFVVTPGLILSNRHVVGAGPVVAQAVLANDEEIAIRPVYRDPIHDFGFFAYNPSDVRYLDIPGIQLAPEGAHVGQEIRVVGNNGGEKFSILSGTMANLYRAAPVYGQGEYNDFNTFYMQASSGTCAGSSGSPVLDLEGRAIGLNCGGNAKNSSYYLPLHRVKHCLDRLLGNKPVHRGTLHADFGHRTFHELRQLGLSATIDDQLRQEGHRGLLVVITAATTHPSLSTSLLEPGDILWQVQGSRVTDFVTLEAILDDHVLDTVSVVVFRHGDRVPLTLRVHDLHHTTPNRYLEIGGGIAHDISYQIARTFGVNVHQGVYVAAAGYIFGTAYCGRRSIITALNNCPVMTLDDLVCIVKQIHDDTHVPIRYYSLTSRKERVMILHMDRRWHHTFLATRNDITGLWDYEKVTTTAPSLLPPSPPRSPSPRVYQAADSIDALKACLVVVDCYPPFVIDGIQTSHAYGAGVIVSLDPPRVVCDRDTVPTAMCSVTLTFRHKVTVPARPVFLHPYHNYVILTFDSVPDHQTYYAKLNRSCCRPGDRIHYVGLDGNNDIKHKITTIASMKNVRTQECTVPRYRAINIEAVHLEHPVDGQGGLLASDSAQVIALWMTFETGEDPLRLQPRHIMAGLPTCYIANWENDNGEESTGGVAVVRHLDVEFWTMQVAHACQLGLKSVDLNSNEQSKVLYVMSKMRPSTTAVGQQLNVGDIVLRINDVPVTRLAHLASSIAGPTVAMTVFRENTVIQLDRVPTTVYDGQETTAVVGWQGLLIQEPHLAAKEQVCGPHLPQGVYVSCCLHGSPAQMALKAGIWITTIDRRPVHTLAAFLEAIAELKTKEYVRVGYVAMDNIAKMSVLRIDNHYWRTWAVQKDLTVSSGWQYTTTHDDDAVTH